jgi:hypothetical protein
VSHPPAWPKKALSPAKHRHDGTLLHAVARNGLEPVPKEMDKLLTIPSSPPPPALVFSFAVVRKLSKSFNGN